MDAREMLKIDAGHIGRALGYMDMSDTTEKTDKGIIYSCYSRKPNNWTVRHDGKNYGHRDLLRIAYLFAVHKKPEGGEFSAEQIKSANDKIMPLPQWSDIDRKFWATLGFVQERIPVSGKGSRPIK